MIALATAVYGTAPILASMGLRLAGAHARPTLESIHVLIGVGLGLALGGAAAGLVRTIHPPGAREHGLRLPEALFASLAPVAFAAVLVIYLP